MFTNLLPRTSRRPVTCSAVASTAALLMTTAACGQLDDPNITFTRIVDTNTRMPGTTRNFGQLVWRSFSGGDVAFNGYVEYFSSYGGVYTTLGGGLRVVADPNTPMPGWTGNFSGFDFFGGAAIGGNEIVFTGSGWKEPTNYYYALYIEHAGRLEVVVDMYTPVPRGEGRFRVFYVPVVEHGRVVFYGRDEDHRNGLYEWTAGNLSVVADSITPIPGTTLTFWDFGAPDIRDGVICFEGFDESGEHQGVYRYEDGVLEVVADTNTPIPGHGGTFQSMGGWSTLSDGNVVFQAQEGMYPGQQGHQGVYVNRSGSLEVVADSFTSIPCRTSSFHYFLGVAISGENVAFLGIESPLGHRGIYAQFGGDLIKVIDLLDRLDGKGIRELYVLRGLDGDQLCFSAYFDDESQGIYVATIRGPGRCAPDMNCDGVLNFSDVSAFRIALVFPDLYSRVYPNCRIELADLNLDGAIDGLDISPFVEVLLQ